MEFVSLAVDIFLHLDKHLDAIIRDYGAWTYALLFLIIFCETGLVFTPFLPGDSLLFAAGALAARGSMGIATLLLLLSVAAILGDTANYWIGKFFGAWIVQRGWIRPAHLAKTHAFFEKYGGSTIVIARFVPIVRTVAPFVAGLGTMTYGKFLAYNVIGGIVWVFLCCLGGYLFGNLPVVKNNFSLVILVIIFLSILPAIWGFLRARLAKPPAPAEP